MPNSLIVPATLVAILAWGPQGARPDQPDFSGSWSLQSSGDVTGAPKTLSIKQTLVQTNARGDPMKPFFKEITITRRSDEGIVSETFQIGLVGGTVAGLPPTGRTMSTHHRVVWEDRALVIESGSYGGPAPETGDWSEHREVWLLDSTGLLHLTVTTRGARDAAKTVTLVYRRESQVGHAF